MTVSFMHTLGDVPIERFLAEHWQKQPLLLRQAFTNFKNPLPPEELAGLSLEQDVQSRLIIERAGQAQSQWQTLHGPFDEDRFATLPPTHWTLLVQQVNTLHPGVHNLLQAFRFLPRWRLEDVMVSYAADQGSVGPHFDYYDVFLLQGQGQRRWQLGQRCDSHTPLRPGLDTKILAQFECQQDWLLQPGDMLYIPPGVAHWGVAQGECITYSIGFRAPSHSEILLDYMSEFASQLSEDQRYSDPDLRLSQHWAEIPNAAIEKLQALINSANDAQHLSRWFGQYMTQPLLGGDELSPLSAEADILAADNTLDRANLHGAGGSLCLAADLRCAFQRMGGQAGQAAVLFIDGQSWHCGVRLAEALTAGGAVELATLSGEDKKLALQLLNCGLLVLPAGQ